MAFISAALRITLQARITAKEAQLTKLYTSYDAANTEIQEYRFDSGEASQRVQYKDLKELGKEIERLEREIDALNRRLNGTGIVNLNLRRKQLNALY